MKKTVNVNIGGNPFTIDEDAYDYLDNYLSSLKRSFRNSKGYNEIIEDIEHRIGEILMESTANSRIVNYRQIEDVINIMGRPSDFEAEEIPNDFEPQGFEKNKGYKKQKLGKRLFRNPHEKVVGGVCSGFAKYLGLQDPTWVRIAVALSFIIGGIGLFPYIILWIAIPEAKTPADHLAMEGDAININNIARKVENEINFFGEKLEDFGKEFSKKTRKW